MSSWRSHEYNLRQWRYYKRLSKIKKNIILKEQKEQEEKENLKNIVKKLEQNKIDKTTNTKPIEAIASTKDVKEIENTEHVEDDKLVDNENTDSKVPIKHTKNIQLNIKKKNK